MEKINVSIVVYDKPIESQYCPMKGIYAGKLLVGRYGFNYSVVKGDDSKYCFIPAENTRLKKKLFKSEPEAKEYAFTAAYWFVDNILGKELE